MSKNKVTFKGPASDFQIGDRYGDAAEKVLANPKAKAVLTDPTASEDDKVGVISRVLGVAEDVAEKVLASVATKLILGG